MQASNPFEESYAQLQLDSALNDVIAMADTDSNIPRKRSYASAVRDLKTNKQYMNQLAQKYNVEAEEFNGKLTSIPYNAIAVLFHISKAPYVLHVE